MYYFIHKYVSTLTYKIFFCKLWNSLLRVFVALVDTIKRTDFLKTTTFKKALENSSKQNQHIISGSHIPTPVKGKIKLVINSFHIKGSGSNPTRGSILTEITLTYSVTSPSLVPTLTLRQTHTS